MMRLPIRDTIQLTRPATAIVQITVDPTNYQKKGREDVIIKFLYSFDDADQKNKKLLFHILNT